jgi:probable F420-dependent oxidoreductase
VKFGITFGRLHHAVWEAAAIEADRLGYESAWLPEHLVFPIEMRGQLVPGEEHPPVPPSTPVYDACAYLSWIAAKTERLRLGTFVYLLGLRHPFVSARAFATLDIVSGGRAIAGVGAGWLTTEWDAVGLDPSTRGARLDEAIEICRRLWTEETVEHHGDHFDFAPVMFEPKPVQRPIPIVVGGESERALRRAATIGDGWIGMAHTPASAAERIARLRAHADGRTRTVEVTVLAAETPNGDDVERFAEAGVDRLVVVPWRRTSEALDGMRRFADEVLHA